MENTHLHSDEAPYIADYRLSVSSIDKMTTWCIDVGNFERQILWNSRLSNTWIHIQDASLCKQNGQMWNCLSSLASQEGCDAWWAALQGTCLAWWLVMKSRIWMWCQSHPSPARCAMAPRTRVLWMGLGRECWLWWRCNCEIVRARRQGWRPRGLQSFAAVAGDVRQYWRTLLSLSHDDERMVAAFSKREVTERPESQSRRSVTMNRCFFKMTD